METTVEQGRHFPQMPSVLPGESDGEYTDRLTGADGTDRVPYDHERNRQCSIGWHGECTDPQGVRCKCPCHTPVGKLELRVRDLEESFIAAWAVAVQARGEAKAAAIRENLKPEVEAVTAQRPELAEWYL